MVTNLLIPVFFAFLASKAWRLFLEASEDIRLIRLLEPWFWFLFLNLLLTFITSNFDYQYAVVGIVLQLALSVWFAISMAWIIQTCHHKNSISYPSLFTKGKTVKFCHRCGTRLPHASHADPVHDHSWQANYLQLPAHLLDYVSFWISLSVAVLVVLFLALKFLRVPNLQHGAIFTAVVLVVLGPPILYLTGRFRKYLSDTKGLIWWSDLKGGFFVWLLLVGLLLWMMFSL
jgi:hypothetical protein